MFVQAVTAGTSPYAWPSPFAGADVCAVAGLALAVGAPRVVFDQDVWVLPLADAHRMVGAKEKLWSFTAIGNPAWRTVAKEILTALLAPQHEAVLAMPHALRTSRSPRTCFRFLQRFTEWFNWLSAHGVTSLDEVTQEWCDRYLEERRWSIPSPRRQRRLLATPTVAEHVRVMQLIAGYGELLSADRYRDGFAPWPGRSPGEVVGQASRSGEQSAAPVPEAMLQPLLATCVFLIDVRRPAYRRPRRRDAGRRYRRRDAVPSAGRARSGGGNGGGDRGAALSRRAAAGRARPTDHPVRSW